MDLNLYDQWLNILDQLNIGVLLMDTDRKIRQFNTSARILIGLEAHEILGADCREIFCDIPCFPTCPFHDPETCHVRDTDIEFLDETGEKHRGTRVGAPLLNDHGRVIGAFAAFRDMTLAHQMDRAITGKHKFHHMIGKDPLMQKIFDMVKVVAKTESTLLIEGSTGTGKDLLAKSIHSESNRSEKPFVKMNCAAIPDNLLESEIFGYIRGAFTGADRDKPGRFSEAHTGTIFLDEIGDLPLSLQAKLLRVLADREFYPLGSRKTKKVDVRIISATNRRLETLVAKKLFREDLFYRLNVFRIELPPLSGRRGDLPLLIRHLMRKQAGITRKPFPGISESSMEILLNYRYPGNIRELENIIEHAIILCREDVISPCHLPAYILDRSPSRMEPPGEETKPETALERQQIVDALVSNSWHRKKTAILLNIDRTTLWRKMRKYGISA